MKRNGLKPQQAGSSTVLRKGLLTAEDVLVGKYVTEEVRNPLPQRLRTEEASAEALGSI